MISTVCTGENNLYGRRTPIAEAMIGSRRGNPAELRFLAATRPEPRNALETTVVDTVFIAGPNDNEHTTQVAKSWGLVTRTFSSGRAVLEANIERQSGCLITELRLPDMSGIELLETLKERASILPAVVLTAHADVPTVIKAVRLGALTVLEKPCPEPDLSAALHEAIQLGRGQREARLQTLEMRSRLESLNSDETMLVEMILDGMKNNVIARRMSVSLRTIENRRRQAYEKMGADCVADLVQRVLLARQTW